MPFSLPPADGRSLPQFPPNSSNRSNFSDQAIWAGHTNPDESRQAEVQSHGIYVTESMEREVMKQRTRAGIMAEEMARWRLLEEKIRMELMLEREKSLRRLESSGARFDSYSGTSSFVHEYSGIPQSMGHLEERRLALPPITPIHQELGFPGFESSPFQRHPMAAPTEPRNETVLLAKSETNISGLKRKAPSPSDHHQASYIGLEKKPRGYIGLEKKTRAHMCLEKKPRGHICLEKKPRGHICLQKKPRGHICLEKKPRGHMCLQKKPRGHICLEKKPWGHIGLEKKPWGKIGLEKKQEWVSEMCNVKTKSERDLNVHMRGQKHKAMEEGAADVLRGGPSSVTKKSNVESTSNPSVKKALKAYGKLPENASIWEQNDEPKKCDNAEPTSNLKVKSVDSIKNGKPGHPTPPQSTGPAKNKFWCEVCQIPLCSGKAAVISSHEKGKRHVRNLLRSNAAPWLLTPLSVEKQVDKSLE